MMQEPAGLPLVFEAHRALRSLWWFLPGYGLDTGWIIEYHRAPLFSAELRDWEIRRTPSLVLREYVPGNVIYANGHRFLPRTYHLEPVPPLLFHVDIGNEAPVEAAETNASGTLGVTMLRAVRVCDVDLPHSSQISDDEDYRFQLAVTVFGHEQDRHGAGKAWRWVPRVCSNGPPSCCGW